MTNSIENSKYGNYNHYHSHHHSHHHYYNPASSHSSSHHHVSSNSNRYINQSDICTTNLNNLTSNELNCKNENNKLSTTTTCTSQLNSSADYLSLQRTLTDSMRCTLKRGRPNTAKTGLSSEYRNRKSSVNTTPELHGNKDLIDNCNKIVSNNGPNNNNNNMDDDNLNNAIIQIDDDEIHNNSNNNKDSDIMNNPLYSNLDDLNDARLDDAIVGGDDDIDNEDDEEDIDDEDDDFNEKSRDTVGIDGIEPINNNMSSNDVRSEENDKSCNRSVLSALPIFPSSSKQTFFDPNIIKFDTMQMNLKQGSNSDMLRRQSLFKLKEKMNGRVSKQINEIEKRKLSPYRFSNSPLKRASTLHKISPLRVPTTVCKSLLKGSNLHEHFKFKKLNNTTTATPTVNVSSSFASANMNMSNFEAKLPTDSPLLAKAANEFSKKKLSRNKSVKRLKITNTNASPLHQTTSTSITINNNKSFNGSPISKNLMQSTQLNCAFESFDF